MSGMTNVLGNTVLTTYFTNSGHWLALHTTDPTAAGISGGEIIGGSYTREQITWTSPSARSVANSNTLTFRNLPATTIHYLGIWTAQSGGDCYYVIPIPAPGVSTNSGGSFTIPVNDITITLQ